MATAARPLIFLHIPKTGGTTLSAVISRHYTGAQTYAIKGADIPGGVARLKALPREQATAIRLLKGHQSFGLHEYLAPGARYVAMIRHPVGRIASHYNYIQNSPSHAMHAPLRQSGYTLAQYAGSRMFPELNNGQTRLLAGVWDDRELGEADLERAIANIEQHFAWVGLMERFDESLIQLGLNLGWLNLRYQKRNVSERASTRLIDAAASAAILAENQFDLRLYEYVQARFDRVSPPYAAARRLAAAGLRCLNGAAARWSALRGGRVLTAPAKPEAARLKPQRAARS